MNKLVYSVYIIMPLILLWHSKFYGKGKFNDEFLSLEQTKALQGFLALCIMLHHIGQKTCASWLTPKTRIIHGLDLFEPMGFMYVAVFLFFNGYGVYKSFHSKDNYLKGFIKRRILPVVLALYTTTIIFFIARLILGEKMDGKLVFFYLTSIKLCNPNTWYVIVLPFFYLAFYLAFKFIKKDGLAVAAVTAFVLLYMFGSCYLLHNDFWIRGEWWYNCVHLFPIGIIFAKFEKQIIAHLKKFYYIYLAIFVLGVYPAYRFSKFVLMFHGYYMEFLPDYPYHKMIGLSSEMLVTFVFTMAVLLVGMKLKIGNKFLAFMGTITLEFYLIHGIFVEMFDHQFCSVVKSPFPIKNVFLYVVLVFILGIPSAVLLKKLHTWILGLGKRNEDSKNKKIA